MWPFLSNFYDWMLKWVWVWTWKLVFITLKMSQILIFGKQIKSVMSLFLLYCYFVKLLNNGFLLNCVINIFYKLRLYVVTWPILCPLLKMLFRWWSISRQAHCYCLFYNVLFKSFFKLNFNILHKLLFLASKT